MTKLPLNTILSGFLSVTKMGQNFDDISDACQNNILYRKNIAGNPNQMEQALDMNNFSILNLKDASTAQEPVTKSQLDAASDLTIANATNTEYLSQGVGAVTRTVKSSLDELLTITSYGTAGDGSTDDKAAIVLAETAAGTAYLRIPKGTYRIASNTTLTANLWFEAGASLAPDTGTTLTLNGLVVGPARAQIFSGLGEVRFGTQVVEEVPIDWFGAVPQSSGAASANVLAIQKALDSVSGVAEYGAPVLIPEGQYFVDGAMTVNNYTMLRGNGKQSQVQCTPSAVSPYSVFQVTTSGANNIVFDNFFISGDGANQTQRIDAIDFNVDGTAAIYCEVRGMTIKEMKGSALRARGTGGLSNSRIIDCMLRDCFTNDITFEKAVLVDITDCRIRSAKSGSASIGLLITGAGNNSINVDNCQFQSNGLYSVNIDNTGTRIYIKNCNFTGGVTSHDIFADGTDFINVVNCAFDASPTSAIVLDTCDWALISRNYVRTTQQHAIVMDNSDNAVCNDNIVFFAGQGTNNTYSGIRAQNGCLNGNISGNTVRHGGGAVKLKYAIEIFDSGSTNMRVTNNDMLNGGFTGALSDAGTATITAAGNRS